MLQLQYHTISLLFTICSFSFLFSANSAVVTNRRLLHQPFIPVDRNSPPDAGNSISQPPVVSPSPQTQPESQPFKYPFSSLYPPDSSQNPFFPLLVSPPPPPQPSSTVFSTFPANISSLVLPNSSSHSSHKPVKLILTILSISLLSVLVLASFLYLLHRYYNCRHLKMEKRPLFPPNTIPSDTTSANAVSKKPPPPTFPQVSASSNSSEFLYLGTLVSSRDANAVPITVQTDQKAPLAAATLLSYERLGSPELQPLPPLPRDNSLCMNFASTGDGYYTHNEEEKYFSRGESTGNNATQFLPSNGFISGEKVNVPNFDPIISNSSRNSISSEGSPSVVLNSFSPQTVESKSPDSLMNFPVGLPRYVPPPSTPPPKVFAVRSPSDKGTPDCSPDISCVREVPSPAPLRSTLWVPPCGAPQLSIPAMTGTENADEGAPSLKKPEIGTEVAVKPKLKPLHWDKVRTGSDKAMVWDHLKSSSFQLNEEMIETLFMLNSSNVNKDGVRCHIVPEANQEHLVLDSKKSQNVAILLRALNVTVEDVCEALSEGNADSLGTELLSSLLKMAPTKEEEKKLKDLKDGSPSMLGTAEIFLKSVLDIPFAFKRVDAMLYIANFDSEIDYLSRAFDTLESACKELKSSRMFRKLLEAVLKIGNHMNVGTNRGDASAFKLDSLLKLVHIKGADGKTTLLHFVVQEIIRIEGARISVANNNLVPEKIQQVSLGDEIEYRKLGLQVVSGLSGELRNVKKAASMNADVLRNDVTKLAGGISKITDVLKVNEEFTSKDSINKFSSQMNLFLNKAEPEIANIQAKEGIALSMVKGLTEFFHGDSAKEEASPLRLFMVVKDFLSILDKVCKDLGKKNDRTLMNSAQKLQIPANPSFLEVFPGLTGNYHHNSTEEASSS